MEMEKERGNPLGGGGGNSLSISFLQVGIGIQRIQNTENRQTGQTNRPSSF